MLNLFMYGWLRPVFKRWYMPAYYKYFQRGLWQAISWILETELFISEVFIFQDWSSNSQQTLIDVKRRKVYVGVWTICFFKKLKLISQFLSSSFSLYTVWYKFFSYHYYSSWEHYQVSLKNAAVLLYVYICFFFLSKWLIYII